MKASEKMSLNRLALDIETNRQRLEHARRNRDYDLEMRVLKLLIQLEASYFDSTKRHYSNETDVEYFLIFSDEFPDGVRLSLNQVQSLMRGMSRGDRECMQVVPIGRGMEQATDQAILLNFESAQNKTGKKPA